MKRCGCMFVGHFVICDVQKHPFDNGRFPSITFHSQCGGRGEHPNLCTCAIFFFPQQMEIRLRPEILFPWPLIASSAQGRIINCYIDKHKRGFLRVLAYEFVCCTVTFWDILWRKKQIFYAQLCCFIQLHGRGGAYFKMKLCNKCSPTN